MAPQTANLNVNAPEPAPLETSLSSSSLTDDDTPIPTPSAPQEGDEPTDAPGTFIILLLIIYNESLIVMNAVNEEVAASTVPPASPSVEARDRSEAHPVGMGIVVGNKAPSSLRPCGRDAYPTLAYFLFYFLLLFIIVSLTKNTYLLIQDLCLLTGGDPAAWIPLPTLSRAFGLELIELVISSYSKLFLNQEFSFLLKDRVCPLVIKSFRFRVCFVFPLLLPQNAIFWY